MSKRHFGVIGAIVLMLGAPFVPSLSVVAGPPDGTGPGSTPAVEDPTADTPEPPATDPPEVDAPEVEPPPVETSEPPPVDPPEVDTPEPPPTDPPPVDTPEPPPTDPLPVDPNEIDTNPAPAPPQQPADPTPPEDDQLPQAAPNPAPSTDGAADGSIEPPGHERTTLCHAVAHKTAYKVLTFPAGGKSLFAHLGHGDGIPGDEIEGQPGYRFDDDCRPEPIPGVCTDDSPDSDGDGVPDCEDICADGDDTIDTDGDGVPDACDVCADGDDTIDTDGDGVPDTCDVCVGGDDTIDDDGNGIPDACQLVVMLTWTGVDDLDLHVVEPSGEEIWWNNMTSATGGVLDEDDVPQCPATATVHEETVSWPSGPAPTGTYEVWVDSYYSCDDGTDDPWTLTAGVGGDAPFFEVSGTGDSARFSFQMPQ